MLVADRYPIGTLLVHRYNRSRHLMCVTFDDMRYWEDPKWGDLFRNVDADLWEVIG